MIGRDSGSTIRSRTRSGPAPSIFAASRSSRGIESKNRMSTITLNALAADGSQTAQNVSCRLMFSSGIRRIVR